MPSTVGLQRTEVAVVEQAVKLELDCVAAYSEAAARLDQPRVADVFEDMAADCRRHVGLWQARLTVLGHAPATANRVTSRLNELKVRAACLLGVRAVALAVRNNPADSTIAYNRVSGREDLSRITRDLANLMLPDAERHAEWIQVLARPGAPLPAPEAQPDGATDRPS